MMQRWTCPNCSVVRVTPHHGGERVVVLHRCKSTHNNFAYPMVREGTNAKIELVVREDYVGKDLVQVDSDNRPIMAIRTVRDDGVDCAVLAPCVVGGGSRGVE